MDCRQGADMQQALVLAEGRNLECVSRYVVQVSTDP
jgi:hypothetical protein